MAIARDQDAPTVIHDDDQPRASLAQASNAQIDAAVAVADPMVLRGLLFYLTGDEEIAATAVAKAGQGVLFSGLAVTNPQDIELLRRKTATFLKRCRDSGTVSMASGSEDRILPSMKLAVGEDFPDEETEFWLEELCLDPWIFAHKWSSPPPSESVEAFSAIVIGAGWGGIDAAAQLKKAGIPFTVVERNAGVGGTWFDNQYPGARVDTPSRTYTHPYAIGFDWPGPYSPQKENLRYLNWVTDRFDLREHIMFDTEVTSLRWDQSAREWEVAISGSADTQVLRANAVISCIGIFRIPNIPDFGGAEQFCGVQTHTARWPVGLTTSGKRIAVIGSGATGYQLIPELAKDAANVTLFQRTPQWVNPLPGYLSKYPEQLSWLDRHLPNHANFMRFRTSWLQGPRARDLMMNIDPDWQDPLTLSKANKIFRDAAIAFMEKKFTDRPDLAARMLPPHPIMSARPVIVDSTYNVFDALLQSNVRLVDQRIEHITGNGMVTEDGEEHEVDIIVYATGFKTDQFFLPMEVRGIDNCRLEDLWAKDGARAYLSTMLPGFPNLFMIYGPNANSLGGFGIVNRVGITNRYILACLGHLIETGKQSICPSREAYDRFGAEADQWEKSKAYMDPRANNYYRSSSGRSTVNCPFPGFRIWSLLRRPNFDDLVVR